MLVSQSEIKGQIKTRVDELIKLIEARPMISAPDAAKELGVQQDMIESWARFLEKTGDIKIAYKGLTPTFETVVKETKKPVEEPSHHDNPWHAISTKLSSHLAQISEAIGSKAYEKVKPAVLALKEQVDGLKERLKSSSVEEEDRKALEASIERVSTRIENVEKNASSSRSLRLKGETKRLTKELDELTSKLTTIKLPEPAPQPVEEPILEPIEPEIDEVDSSFDDTIKNLESQARAAVERGDLKAAEAVYARIEELYEETLPKQYAQMRSTLKDHIYTLKKDITFASDDFEKRRVHDVLDHITTSIEAFGSSVTNNDWSAAEKLENDIVELYNSLPRGFEVEKQAIEEKFGQLIMRAAEKRRTVLNEALTRLSKEIDVIRHELAENLNASNISGAYDAYRRIKERFDTVPSQLVIERIDLQVAMLEDFKRLALTFKERFIAKNESHIESCTHSIEDAKNALKASDLEAAHAAYAQARSELASIDHNYFEQRSRIHYDLMRVHKDLLDANANDTESNFESLVSEFQAKLQDGRSHLADHEPELAERIYLDLLEMYRSLPRGHEERKKAIREQIFDYYKELTTDTKDEEPVSLNEILERLVTIHHALNSGDPTVLASDLNRIEQLIDTLPDRIRKHNPMLDRELLRLVHLKRIYEGILEANSAIDRGEQTSRYAEFIDESERWIESENVSAAAIIMLLRSLKKRLVPRELPREAPQPAPKQPSHVADLKTRIDSIKSFLNE